MSELTDKQILDWIGSHYPVGRKTLSRELGIPEGRARSLLVVFNKQAEMKGIEIKKLDPKKAVEDFLQEKGMNWQQVQDLLTQKTYPVMQIRTGSKREFSFGISSDLHYCDKACAVDEIADFYDQCSKAGCEFMVNAGDITAGNNVYKGQYNDLAVFGYSDQLNYIEKTLPKLANGGKTYLISGNHDLSFKQNNGAHFISALSERRPDLVDCGDYDGSIEVNGIKIGLHHGGGGNAYAISYKLQKAIELIGSDQKPQIYVLGHYHASLYTFMRNIHCFLPGCFQKPNDLSVRFNLPNTIGGWIVHLVIDNDRQNTISKIVTEYVAYYR